MPTKVYGFFLVIESGTLLVTTQYIGEEHERND